jgi:hypothetical protein
MVQINFAQKQVNAKVVYYGPGMSGKTTNLEVVHQRAPQENRGELTSISTDGDRTLFFDFMPLDLGTVAGMKTCFQIYTVPGQVYYNSTRKLVLQGVDGVIFVADSSASMVEENLESLRNLEANMAEYGRSLADLPMVIQYNKRDLTDALPIESLERELNPRGLRSFEATAHTGQGVFPTLKALAAAVLESIHSQQQSTNADRAPVAPAPSPQPAAAPVAPAVAQAPAGAAMPPVAPVAAEASSTAPAPAPAEDDPRATEPASIPLPVSPAAAQQAPPPAPAPHPVPTTQPARSSIRLSAAEPEQPSQPAPAAPQPPACAPPAPLTLASVPTPSVPQAATPPPQPGLDAAHTAAATPVVADTRTLMEPDHDLVAPPPPRAVVHPLGVADEAAARRSAARPTPVVSPGHQSALVTGVIVIVSVGLGAVLGSLALSFLQ